MRGSGDSRLTRDKLPRGVGIAARSIAFCVGHTRLKLRIGSECALVSMSVGSAVLKIPVVSSLPTDLRPIYILDHSLHQDPGRDEIARSVRRISALSKNPSFGCAPWVGHVYAYYWTNGGGGCRDAQTVGLALTHSRSGLQGRHRNTGDQIVDTACDHRHLARRPQQSSDSSSAEGLTAGIRRTPGRRKMHCNCTCRRHIACLSSIPGPS